MIRGEAPALHCRFLNRRVDLPLHPSWAEWLWDRGFGSGETEALHSVGIHAYRCRPDISQLEEDISAAVLRGRQVSGNVSQTARRLGWVSWWEGRDG